MNKEKYLFRDKNKFKYKFFYGLKKITKELNMMNHLEFKKKNGENRMGMSKFMISFSSICKKEPIYITSIKLPILFNQEKKIKKIKRLISKDFASKIMNNNMLDSVRNYEGGYKSRIISCKNKKQLPKIKSSVNFFDINDIKGIGRILNENLVNGKQAVIEDFKITFRNIHV